MTTVKMKLRITTCVKPDSLILKYLEEIISDVKTYSDVTYTVINRRKLTIKNLFEDDGTPVLVIQQSGVVLYTAVDNKIFYHENTTRVKYKSYISGNDIPPLVDLIQDESVNTDVIIDATTGMANDLILMAMTMKRSTFYAFEDNFYIHFAIKWGVRFYFKENAKNQLDTSRIHFIYGHIMHRLDLLQSAHLIYLDPMYEETITTSNISALVNVVKHDIKSDRKLLDTIFEHFTGKVILRAHYKSRLIHEYEFIMRVRKQTKTHYGYLYI